MIAEHEKSKEEKKGYDKYDIDNACRTLMEAEEIKQNAELMKLVSKKIAEKKKAINSIDDLRQKSKELESEESEED